MYESYVRCFNRNCYGNRAPIHIGHHFSRMNGGAYWRAMQRFARYARGKPNVVCGTCKELMNFVVRNKARLDAYQAGNFDKPAPPPAMLAAMASEVSNKELEKFLARERGRATGCGMHLSHKKR